MNISIEKSAFFILLSNDSIFSAVAVAVAVAVVVIQTLIQNQCCKCGVLWHASTQTQNKQTTTNTLKILYGAV